MKIAKKVLALLMAVAMIAALSAMAFADEPTIELKASEVAEDGSFTLSIWVKDAEFKEFDWVLKYDEANLEVVGGEYCAYTADGLARPVGSGLIMVAFNANTAGQILIGGACQHTIKEDAGKAFVDGEGCEFICVDFKLNDAAAKNVNVALEVKDAAEGVNPVLAATVINEEVVPETPAPETPAPETPAPETPVDENKPAETPTTDNVSPKGDTGALAIVAGVVAVAGAAFVVSKKKR